MKKIIAILLGVLLVLCSAFGAAESDEKVVIGNIHINGAFTLRCTMPEGYSVKSTDISSSQFIAVIATDDPVQPMMVLSVAYEEIYSDVDRLNDLESDPEAMALLEATFTENDPGVEITYDETGLGTRLLISRQSGEIANYIDYMSIYKGHLIEFILVPGMEAEDKTLTDEQFEMGRKFLTDLDFDPIVFGEDNAEEQLKSMMFPATISNYNAEDDTVQITVMHSFVLDAAEAEALKEGDTLTVGQFSETIHTLSKPEDGIILINDSIELVNYGGEYHLYVGGPEYMEELVTVVRELPKGEGEILLDDIDPETGEAGEATTARSADELREILKGEKYPADPGFPWEHVYVAFNEDGEISLIQRGLVQ